MNRRTFLRNAGLLTGGGLVGRRLRAAVPVGARTFQVTTHVELPLAKGVSRVWVPLPLRRAVFQECLQTDLHCPDGQFRIYEEQGMGREPGMVAAIFAAGTRPVLTVVSRVRVWDWSVALRGETPRHGLSAAEREAFLQPTRYVPTDGVVRKKALEIVAGAGGDLEKARAIYEWMVAKAYRKPETRGCGRGNIRAMLETGDLGGKCADLNGLFVGLARAAGLPARDVYGLRVGPSRLGYRSLGPATGEVTRAQHCRAEVWIDALGWLPVDPADVRKVMLEEPPGALDANEEKVRTARERLFGSWEMNWIALNDAQDVALPGSDGPRLPFLMYPQAEVNEGRLDSLDPDSFTYRIGAEERSSA